MTEIQKYTEIRTFDSDSAMDIFGVAGRLKTRSVCSKTKVGCWESQTWISERRTKTINGDKVIMHANIRFDDSCHNGHNDFAITGHGWYEKVNNRDWDFGGCCHDLISEIFPELEPLIKWHLVSTDGPLHYVANTLYLAGDMDYNGRRKGEPCSWEKRFRFSAFPTMTFAIKDGLIDALLDVQETRRKPGILDIIEVPYTGKDNPNGVYRPKYTLACYPVDAWYKAPFDTRAEALEWQTSLLVTESYEEVKIITAYSQGKERELDAARRAAAWPEATDEQLSLPREELKALLEARLPALQADFRKVIADIGMAWSPEEFEDK